MSQLGLSADEVGCVVEDLGGVLDDDVVLGLIDDADASPDARSVLDDALVACTLTTVAAMGADSDDGTADGSDTSPDASSGSSTHDSETPSVDTSVSGRLPSSEVVTITTGPQTRGTVLGTDSPPVEPATGAAMSYGDDPALDALWDQCAAKGTDACDELFNRSPAGSDYESFGDTCGERGPPQVACAPDALAEPTPTAPASAGDPVGYGDDPGLDELWRDCAGGDDQGCLALQFQAPADSDYAAFASACIDDRDGPVCVAGSEDVLG